VDTRTVDPGRNAVCKSRSARTYVESDNENCVSQLNMAVSWMSVESRITKYDIGRPEAPAAGALLRVPATVTLSCLRS
jgi:hypothetical protein